MRINHNRYLLCYSHYKPQFKISESLLCSEILDGIIIIINML